MTPTQLDEIEKRAKDATEGPWSLDGYPRGDEVRGDHEIVAPCPVGVWPDNMTDERCTGPNPPVGTVTIIESDGGLYWRQDCRRNDSADRTFIAHARTDVPALVAEVRRLRRGIEFEIDQTGSTRLERRYRLTAVLKGET